MSESSNSAGGKFSPLKKSRITKLTRIIGVKSALLALMSSITYSVAPLAVSQENTSNVIFVVDTSGSMDGSRLEQAKDALRKNIGELGVQQAAGLRSYGGGCGDDGELRVPLATGNRDQLLSAIDELYADGGTPTDAALRAATNDLPQTGKRTIVLVSDGESGCGDPCEVAKELKQNQGINFKVHTVGFYADEGTSGEMKCIADATGGKYFSADNTETLTKALNEASADPEPRNSNFPGWIDCERPTFIAVRGSGEEPQFGLSNYGIDRLRNRPFINPAEDGRPQDAYYGFGTQIKDIFVDLQKRGDINGAFNAVALDYPAVPVTWDSILLSRYASSIEEGQRNLWNLLAAIHEECRGKNNIALMGYSQGAEVIDRTLVEAASADFAESIRHISVLGDPQMTSGYPGYQGQVTKKLLFGVTRVVTWGYESVDPKRLQHVSSRYASYCAIGDPVCSWTGNIGAELSGLGAHVRAYSWEKQGVLCRFNHNAHTTLRSCIANRAANDMGYSGANNVKTDPLNWVTPVDLVPGAKMVIKGLATVGEPIVAIPGTWLGKTLRFFIHSEPIELGEKTVDENGFLEYEFEIPEGIEPGVHEIVITNDLGEELRIPVNVGEGEGFLDEFHISLDLDEHFGNTEQVPAPPTDVSSSGSSKLSSNLVGSSGNFF